MRAAALLPLIGLIVLSPLQARTERTDTVEWMTCGSRYVLVGKLTVCEFVGWDDTEIIRDCTIEVIEGIKGFTKGPFTFRIRYIKEPPDWMKLGTELLVFLQPPPQDPAPKPISNFPIPFNRTGVINLAELPPNLRNKDNQPLIWDTEILKICREWAASPITHCILLPEGLRSYYFAVPAEEKYRLPYIEQTHSKDPYQRMIAARQLASYPGPDTDAALMRLLEDETSSISWSRHEEVPGYVYYTVRSDALQSLWALGKKPANVIWRRPLTEEEERWERHNYWHKTIDQAMPGGWQVTSVEEGETHRAEGQRTLTIMRVKCAKTKEGKQCTLMLVPNAWPAIAPLPKMRCLGDSQKLGWGGDCSVYLEGNISSDDETVIASRFKLLEHLTR